MNWIEAPVKTEKLDFDVYPAKPCSSLNDVNDTCYSYGSCKSKTVGC